jgi:hypothetical protein
MSTRIPGTIHPYPPIPGQPSGVGTFIPGHPYASSGPFGGHATLATGLVSAWKLSADGLDSHSTNDLTNNNSVTFVAKGAGAPANMPANVANFVAASSQTFNSNSNPISAATAMTLNFWVNDYTTGRLVSIDNGVSRLFIHVHSTSTYFLYGTDAGNVQVVHNLSGASWRMVTLTLSDSDKIGRTYENGSLIDTSAALAANPNWASVAKFRIGSSDTPDNYATARVSSPALWSRVLIAGEITDLYAAGDGLFY